MINKTHPHALRPLQIDSLARRAAETIRNYIVQVGLKIGDRLPTERSMASAMLISRVTIREALAALESEGLIVRRRGCRSIVAAKAHAMQAKHKKKLEHEHARQTELRSAVQVGAAVYACERRTEEQLRRLRAIMARWEKNFRRHATVCAEDGEFHDVMMECAGPAFAAVGKELVREDFRLLAEIHPEALNVMCDWETLQVHLEMVDALEQRDLPRLIKLLLPGPKRHMMPVPLKFESMNPPRDNPPAV